MKFFKLIESSTASEIGVSPQVVTSERAGDDRKWREILPIDGPIPVLPKFPRFFLERKAKPTDFLISSPTSGYEMISAAFYAFLQKFKMDEHQAYPIEVIRYGNKSEKYDYFLMRFCYSKSSIFVDWERSVWGHATGLLGFELVRETKFASYNDYRDYSNLIFAKSDILIPRQFYLQTEKIDFDIFSLRGVGGARGVYVSERLKNAIEAEKITGCQFVPSEEVRKRTTKENYPYMERPG